MKKILVSMFLLVFGLCLVGCDSNSRINIPKSQSIQITKYENGSGSKKAIEEEVVDVLLILKQLKWFYQLSPLNVLLMNRKKRKRTLKRMEEGYYEANTR